MLKQILSALVILAMAGFLTWWFYPDSESQQANGPREGRATPVNVYSPQSRVLTNRLQAVGTTAARDAVDITAEVDGRVVELRFTDGDRVEAGDVLVVLDERQARADLAVTEARYEDAESRFARAEQLRANDNISQAEYDERRAALRVAEAERDAARTRLENRRIVAPFDGTLGLREVSRGAWLRAGDRITTLDTMADMELRFRVPERYISRVMPQQLVTATSGSYPDETFTGEVRELDSRIDPLSRTLAVRARIDNEARRLRPGQFLNLTLVFGEREALMIPEQAVLTQGNEQYAYVVEADTAVRRSLTLGQRQPGWVEVVTGIAADDAVIITGITRVSDGARVSVLEDPDALVPLDQIPRLNR